MLLMIKNGRLFVESWGFGNFYHIQMLPRDQFQATRDQLANPLGLHAWHHALRSPLLPPTPWEEMGCSSYGLFGVTLPISKCSLAITWEPATGDSPNCSRMEDCCSVVERWIRTGPFIVCFLCSLWCCKKSHDFLLSDQTTVKQTSVLKPSPMIFVSEPPHVEFEPFTLKSEALDPSWRTFIREALWAFFVSFLLKFSTCYWRIPYQLCCNPKKKLAGGRAASIDFPPSRLWGHLQLQARCSCFGEGSFRPATKWFFQVGVPRTDWFFHITGSCAEPVGCCWLPSLVFIGPKRADETSLPLLYIDAELAAGASFLSGTDGLIIRH